MWLHMYCINWWFCNCSDSNWPVWGPSGYSDLPTFLSVTNLWYQFENKPYIYQLVFWLSFFRREYQENFESWKPKGIFSSRISALYFKDVPTANKIENFQSYAQTLKAASQKNLYSGFSIFAGGKVMIEKTQFMICERKPNLSSKYSLILPFMYT